MPRSIPAKVKPELLQWARKTAHVRTEDAVSKLELPIDEWENGVGGPSIAELRKLAEFYKRPLAVFFLSEIPRDFKPHKEFRRLPDLPPDEESPELVAALREAVYRRETAITTLLALGENPGTFPAIAHPEEDAELVGKRMRELLKISWADQVSWREEYDGLNHWRQAIENTGVLVFQASGINIQEMRGTCIPDAPFPIILLNNKDVPKGRVFTLVHEFAHILMHQAGHATSRIEGTREPGEQRMEVAANAFAAATVLPKSYFLSLVEEYPAAKRGDDEALTKLSRLSSVSSEVVLRRMQTLGIVSEEIYRRKRVEWRSRPVPAKPKSDGGPSMDIKTVSKLGPAFITLMLQGYHQNAVSSSEISDALGVKLKHLDAITERVLSYA